MLIRIVDKSKARWLTIEYQNDSTARDSDESQ